MTRRHVSTDLAERLLAGPVVWIGLVLLTAFALGPFIWMLLTSLKDRHGTLRHAAAVPAGASHLRKLCRCMDLAGHAIQPVLFQ